MKNTTKKPTNLLEGIKFIDMKNVIDTPRLFKEADIVPGESVLILPSDTSITARAKRAGGEITCIEPDRAKAEALRAQGFPTAEVEFLDWCLCDQYDEATGEVSRPQFNKVLMVRLNDWEKAMRHVVAAYELCMKSGGILSAIVGAPCFAEKTETSKGFVRWLKSIGAIYEPVKGNEKTYIVVLFR